MLPVTLAAQENTDLSSLAAFCLPETRVWGPRRENTAFIGSARWLSSTSRWGRQYRYDGTVSGRLVGLDYAKNRYYSNTLGRFLSADPYRPSADPTDPITWNRYLYVRDDPANRWDRTGLDDDPDNPNPFCGGDPDPCAGNPGDGGGGGGWGCDPSGTPFAPGGGGGPAPCQPAGGPAPPPKQPQLPECFAQLKFRGVNDWKAWLANATHAFWWVQSDTGDYILTAGPTGNYLQAWAIPGDSSPNKLDTKNQKTWWSSGLSSAICPEVDAMVAAAKAFPGQTFLYDPAGTSGPNSNSFAHYLAQVGMFSPTQPPYSYGWWFPTLVI